MDGRQEQNGGNGGGASAHERLKACIEEAARARARARELREHAKELRATAREVGNGGVPAR